MPSRVRSYRATGTSSATRPAFWGGWIRLILVASVTSLPELVTGISSVTVAAAPNIAVGDVMGSCVFNLAILVVVDLLYREEPVYGRASQGHILSAGFGVILIGFSGLNVMLGSPPCRACIRAHRRLYANHLVALPA